MNTKIDNERFDAYARSFLAALAAHIENRLRDTKLSKQDRTALVQSLTFNVASLLDGTGSVDHEQTPLIPHLSFELHGEGFTVVDDGTIALHELVELE